MYNQKAELFAITREIINKANDIDVSSVDGGHDCMLNIHIAYESLQTVCRNKSLTGFDPILAAIVELGSQALSMAASLSAKIKYQRQLTIIRQNEEEDSDAEGNMSLTFIESPTIKEKKRQYRKKTKTVIKPVVKKGRRKAKTT